MSNLKKDLGAGKSSSADPNFEEIVLGKVARWKKVNVTQELYNFLITVHPDAGEAVKILLDRGEARKYIEIRGNRAKPLLALKGGKE